ncbi:arpin-like isoform X1 [Dendronephthya gigantea]|uniref:arpin-like isoform X1 n=1 Tax=Dendronephthya gigantea TaxID=151771 RepID=UPI00106A753C|nr:arpin-like isoform X1 [Dendronephthya gigantea]
MSRAHMLYDDKAIDKVLNVKWQERWSEETIFRLKQGNGFIIEGKVKAKYKVAINESTSGKIVGQYSLLHLEFIRAYKRSFDNSSCEIEPWKSGTKKVNTGHLMSSYKTVDVETSAISLQELMVLLNVPELDGYLPKLETNTLQVFYKKGSLGNIEASVGERFRLKTKGDGPYIEYIARLDEGHVSSSEYEREGQKSWTDKIMSMKGQEFQTSDQPDGVDESEWDD